MRLFQTLICIALLGTANAVARPVSYSGGWTVMQMNDMEALSLHVHYSPAVKYSLGYRAEYRRNKNWQFHGVQMNYLVKRLNKPASQANFYLKSGAGFAYSDYRRFDAKVEPAAFAGVALDWEDRRYFVLYENRAYHAGEIDKAFSQKARVGIAPYKGDYGALHTWLMLQVDHNPKAGDEVVFTPLLRFFKSEYLVEAGVSENGDILFNWIVRF